MESPANAEHSAWQHIARCSIHNVEFIRVTNSTSWIGVDQFTGIIFKKM